jgi:hypothetical protein
MSLILGEWRWDGRMLLAGCLPCMSSQPLLRERSVVQYSPRWLQTIRDHCSQSNNPVLEF